VIGETLTTAKPPLTTVLNNIAKRLRAAVSVSLTALKAF